MVDVDTFTARWTEGALIRVMQPGADWQYRPALFVLGLPGGGAAWVEPHYLDPAGAAVPALHAAEAAPAEDITKPHGPPVLSMASPGWTAIAMEMPYDGPDQLLQPLEWALGELKRQGTTWEAERERVRVLLLGPLG